MSLWPFVSTVSDSPQCLQSIASGSNRFRPHSGRIYLIYDSWKMARASCEKGATPATMEKIDNSLPPGVVSSAAVAMK